MALAWRWHVADIIISAGASLALLRKASLAGQPGVAAAGWRWRKQCLSGS